jgi:hypothetical protein
VIDIDLDAIRARDANWHDDGCGSARRNLASGDRRALLEYIDELELLVAEIAADVNLIKRVHREHYRPKATEAVPEDAAVAFEEQRAEERRARQREYDSQR